MWIARWDPIAMQFKRILVLMIAGMFVISDVLQNVDGAPVKRGMDGAADSAITTDTSSTTDQTPPQLDPKGDVVWDEDEQSVIPLGPWGIAGIVIAVVALIGMGVVVAVTVNRQRKRQSSSSEEEDKRPMKFVPLDDNSWRGPPPFIERIDIPNSDSEDAPSEADEELTIMEPPLKKIT